MTPSPWLLLPFVLAVDIAAGFLWSQGVEDRRRRREQERRLSRVERKVRYRCPTPWCGFVSAGTVTDGAVQDDGSAVYYPSCHGCGNRLRIALPAP